MHVHVKILILPSIRSCIRVCARAYINENKKRENDKPWKLESLRVLEATSLAATLPQLPLPMIATFDLLEAIESK